MPQDQWLGTWAWWWHVSWSFLPGILLLLLDSYTLQESKPEVCLWKCVVECVCAHASMHVKARGWCYHSSTAIPSYLEVSDLIRLAGHQAPVPSCFQHGDCRYMLPCLAFSHGSWGANLGPHVCRTDTLSWAISPYSSTAVLLAALKVVLFTFHHPGKMH